MTKKQHTLSPTPAIIKQIDYTLPKLKYSVSVRKVIRWLENFKEDEVLNAIDFLFFLEYIDFAELTFRIDEQLKKVLKQIPVYNRIVIFPAIAKYPKSPEIINYILSKTPTYIENKSRFSITRDPDIFKTFPEDISVILTDDFIGSGNSFKEGYDTISKLKKHLDTLSNVKQRFLLAAITMESGEIFIKNNYKEIMIFAESRNSIFNLKSSPFLLKKNLHELKELALKYGKIISPKPLGYSDTEALVAFVHSSPNNTLPIIWGDKDWYPIFPRYGSERVYQSTEFKKEISFFIGIMNRLGLDLYSNESILVKGKRVIKYNKLKDHSLLCVIKLKIEKFELASICQMLGITTGEYKSIIDYGKSLELLNHSGDLTTIGYNFYNNLIKNAWQKRFIKKDKELFEMKYVNYVPKSFGGLT